MVSDDDLKGSEARFWRMIEERARPGADVARVDARIWDLFGDTSAIMFTDLAGFSRKSAEHGILSTLQSVLEHKRLLLPVVAEHDGILLKVIADSMLVTFKRVANAIAAAISMQRLCKEHNASRSPETQLLLCIGLGYGNVVRLGDRDVYGTEVNAASKLGEDTARAYEILVTDGVRCAASERADLAFEELGTTVPGSARSWRLIYER